MPARLRLILCAAGAMLALCGTAAADGISVTGPSTGTKGQKLTFNVQGEASSEGSAPYEVRALFGTDECAPDWLLSLGSNLVSLSGGEPLIKTTGGPFNQDASVTPDAGGAYHVCAYLLSTNHPVAMTLAKASTSVVIPGGTTTTTKTPSRATLYKRALAKCKKLKSAKKRAACRKAAKKKYGPKR
jgi:hypothetical protein